MSDWVKGVCELGKEYVENECLRIGTRRWRVYVSLLENDGSGKSNSFGHTRLGLELELELELELGSIPLFTT